MKHNSNYWLLSGFFFFYFFALTSTMSFFSIWLGQHINLSGTEVGIIFSVNAIATVCIQPLYGFISDKFGLKKRMLWIISLLLLLVGPFFIYVYDPLLQYNIFLGAIIGSIYISAALLAGMGAVESYIEKVGKKYNFEYGRARMWGSLGAAAAAFFSGQLFNINPEINFWIASACSLLLMVLLIFTKVEVTEVEKQKTESLKIKDALLLFKNNTFWTFVLYVIGVACVYSVYDQQFPIYYASLFETPELGNQMFGYLNSIQVFAEAGMMFVAPFIVNKIGAKKGLVLAGMIMAVRILGSGLVDGPTGISMVKMLHSLELPIMLVAIFKYIDFNFDARLSATIYLVGYHLFSQFGQAILSPIVGNLYDVIGFAQTYIILGIVVFAFVMIFAFIRPKQQFKDVGNRKLAGQG